MFTREELVVIVELINRSNIRGGESIPVSTLLQKIQGIIKEMAPEVKEEV